MSVFTAEPTEHNIHVVGAGRIFQLRAGQKLGKTIMAIEFQTKIFVVFFEKSITMYKGVWGKAPGS